MATEEVTFVRMRLTPFEVKLARFLKKKGFKLNSVTFYELNGEHKKIFDNDIYFLKEKQRNLSMFKKLLQFPRFFRSLKQIKKTVIIGVTSSSNWFVTAMFLLFRRRAQSKIYFPYDITYFRYKNYKKYPWYVRLCEKYNFRHCDGIMHKGSENELRYLPKEFKALDKPDIQFLPYCDNDFIIDINDEYFQKKLSTEDKKIHLVYVGKVPYQSPIRYPFIDVFKEIIKQEIHLDVYPTNFKEIVDDVECKKLQKSKYFTLHRPIYNHNLQIELSKYDWGLNPAFHKSETIKKEWLEISTGNKMSTYLESGLPMIINDELSFSADVTVQNGFGLVIEPWTIKEAKEKIENINYNNFIETLKDNRDKFTIGGNIDRLVSFMEKLNQKK